MPRNVFPAETRSRKPLSFLLASLASLLTLAGLASAAAAAGDGATAERAVELVRTKNGFTLELGTKLATSWRDVNVGRLVIQTPAKQRRLDLGLPTKSRRMIVDLHEATDVCALLLAELGPPSAQGYADSWQRVTQVSKHVVCPEGSSLEALEARRRAGASLTAKSGSRIEVRPMTNPATVRPGSDLAVAVYFEGSAQADVEVTASGPDGTELAAVTSPTGIAILRIPAAGAWTVSFTTPRGGETLAASLSFDVLDDTAWQPFLGGALPGGALPGGAQR